MIDKNVLIEMIEKSDRHLSEMRDTLANLESVPSNKEEHLEPLRKAYALELEGNATYKKWLKETG